MTLLDERPTTSPQPAVSGAAGWRGSWRVSLRMARRDVRRHKGRSAIVALMAGLPIALLCFAFTMAATVTITGAERIPSELGSATAAVSVAQLGQVVSQEPDGNGWGCCSDEKGLNIPGYPANGTLSAQTAAIGAFVNGRAVIDFTASGRVQLSGSNPEAQIGQLNPDGGSTPLARLVEGSWPTGPTEAVISRDSRIGSLPTRGDLTVLLNGQRYPLTVVGVVDTAARVDVFTPLEVGARNTPAWLIERAAPVTWAEVQRLNRYGLAVLSAEVLRNPPPASEVDNRVADTGLYALGALFLALIVILLTAPAFAVSASRQRRTLALAAANGAEQRQLRRAVLAQGVVLGALSVIGGAVVGVGAAYALSQWFPPTYSWGGPWDVPWLAILGVCLLGVVACVVAALLPAFRLGRLDVVGVMKGHSVSPAPRRWLAVLGLASTLTATAFLLLAPVSDSHFVTASPTREFCAAAIIALCLGGLMTVPWLLVTLGRHSSRLPVALRMAARDTARHRSRSIPTVAATLAATAAVVAALVSFASMDSYEARNYVASTVPGESFVNSLYDGSPAATREVTAAVRQLYPHFVITPLRVVSDPYVVAASSYNPQDNKPVTKGHITAVLLPGCTLEQAAQPPSTGWSSDRSLPNPDHCSRYSSSGFTTNSSLAVLPASEIERRLDLSAGQRAALDRGALVMLGDALPQVVTVAGADYTVGNETTYRDVVEHAGVPVVAIAPTIDNGAAFTSVAGVLTTPQTAASLGWTDHLADGGALVRNPAGSISEQAEQRIDDQLTTTSFAVERGFRSSSATIVAVLLAVLLTLLLVTTLTSTALAMAEQRADDATMAAVGATRRTRRLMAAGHAYWLGILATVFGALAGVVVGQGLARLAVAQRMAYADGTVPDATVFVTIPWLSIVAIVVIAPLVAAALAWLAVRKAPRVTRRAT
ncbi:ABC transporter permease [Branchiibius cervicis]|uniref:FtsX-like permease family protein n=1 Tax=Branchiibius cervicis TaxID=908252 RepID=A0ABW2AXI0_9MICO